MAQLKSLKQVLLAKTEATYGVDPIPTGAANAMLVSNLKINPIQVGTADRKVILPYLGQFGKVVTERHAEVSFDIELTASGTAGVAPAYAPILKACALSETIAAGVSVVYAPVSGAEQSATFYANVDGMMYRMSGAKGTMTAKLSNKATPMLSFKFLAMYATPTDVAIPAATLSAFKAPLAINAQNTTATLHGYTAPVSDFNFDLGNKTAYRSLINGEQIIFSDRSTTGSITLEQPTMLQKDFFAAITSATTAPFTLTHGLVAGAKVKLDAPLVQLTDVQLSDLDGIQMIQMPMQMLPSLGNDELVLTFM